MHAVLVIAYCVTYLRGNNRDPLWCRFKPTRRRTVRFVLEGSQTSDTGIQVASSKKTTSVRKKWEGNLCIWQKR